MVRQHHSTSCFRSDPVTKPTRSTPRILHHTLDVNGWLAYPPSPESARPGACPDCGAPSRPTGGGLGLHSHGVRDRQLACSTRSNFVVASRRTPARQVCSLNNEPTKRSHQHRRGTNRDRPEVADLRLRCDGKYDCNFWARVSLDSGLDCPELARLDTTPRLAEFVTTPQRSSPFGATGRKRYPRTPVATRTPSSPPTARGFTARSPDIRRNAHRSRDRPRAVGGHGRRLRSLAVSMRLARQLSGSVDPGRG